MRKSQIIKISILITGLSGIIAQITLLRELLISFLGNELTIAIILANWMVLEGFGAFVIGKSADSNKNKLNIYVLFLLIFSFVFPFCIHFSRVFKTAFLVSPGQAVGFLLIYIASFLILMPVSIVHGALFTYGCKNYSLVCNHHNGRSAGSTYFLETAGTILGSLFYTFLMIRFLNSFEIAFTISLINAAISTLLILLVEKNYRHSISGKTLLLISILFTSIFVFLLLPESSGKIQHYSIKKQWEGLDVVHYENSIYGNLAVTKRSEQYTFYTDGIPSITTPVPDIATIEDFVHFTMLFHKKPENVLIISGGAGGIINEILKYPVKIVDYVELDPLIIKLVEKYSTPITQHELSDMRVNVHYMDGRFFVQKTEKKYDIIFIGLEAPQELQTNRLYTSNFFSLAKKKIKPDGIIALTLPGSLTYIGPQLGDLHWCIYSTLKKVIKHIRIIPGDTTIYIASDNQELEKITSREIIERFLKRSINTSLFTDLYIEYRLHERWIEWFEQSIYREQRIINTDFRPLGVFYYLSYWNALFSPYILSVFNWIKGIKILHLILLPAFFIATVIAVSIKIPRATAISIPYSIFSTGFCGIIFDIAIIFAFQSVYGYLYYQIGILIAVFMVGVALSSYTVTKYLPGMGKPLLIFLMSEVFIICFTLLIPFIFITLERYIQYRPVGGIIYLIFLLISFFSGIFTGFQFPLASNIHLETVGRGSLGYTAGLLYSADLLGGFLGGLAGGIILLPVLGLRDTFFILAIIKASSFLFLLLFKRYRFMYLNKTQYTRAKLFSNTP